MPVMEDPLDAREQQDPSFGKRLAASELQDAAPLATGQRSAPGAVPEPRPQARSQCEVAPQGLSDRSQEPSRAQGRTGREFAKALDGGLPESELDPQLPTERRARLLERLESLGLALEIARNLMIEIAAENAAQGHGHHRPEAKRHEPPHLEGAVQNHKQGTEYAQVDVHAQPVPDRAGVAEWTPSLAKAVGKQKEHHGRAQDAEPMAHETGGAQVAVVRVLGALLERREVVLTPPPEQPDHRKGGDRGQGDHSRPEQAVADVGSATREDRRSGQRMGNEECESLFRATTQV